MFCIFLNRLSLGELNYSLFAFLLSWFITHFEPLQELLIKFFSKYRCNPLFNILSCWKCLSLWLTLFITFDIMSAFFCSFVVWLLMRLIEKQ